MTRVSAGIVRREDGRILICRRGEGRKNAHLWEFPGGKQEAGESPEDCLSRELMEELSLPVSHVKMLCTAEAQGLTFDFLTADTASQPHPTEHEDFAFVTPRELKGHPFCPADRTIAMQLAFDGVTCCLWDFDGTLADTYPMLTDVLVRLMHHHGVPVTPERVLSLLKVSLIFACTTLSALCRISAETLLAECREEEGNRFLEQLAPVDGIPETLERLLAHGFRHYVVTHRDLRCREALERLGLLPYFSGLVTAEDGLPRKPAPDMVRCCMSRYGLQPDDCAIIGDRPLDTRAGQAAGIRTVLLDTNARVTAEKSADVRIESPLELQTLLLPAWKH